MSQIDDDRPEFVVAQRSLRPGHAGRTDSVVQNPFELAVGIALNLLGGQQRNRGLNVLCKGNARVLTIHPMTGNTIMRERLLAVGQGIGV
jgi:hypothetical protein